MDGVTPDLSFSKQNEELFKKHFPAGLDDLTAVVKAHLYLETMFRDFCARSLPHPAHLKDARLTFKQISLLARALCRLPHPNFDYVWVLVAKLNSLRNAMAHELEPEQAKIDNLRASIISLIQQHSSDGLKYESFSRALGYMCGLVDCLLQVSLVLVDPKLSAKGGTSLVGAVEHIHREFGSVE